MSALKTYIVVNSDLNMTPGQVAAQVAHAALAMANTMHLESMENFADGSNSVSTQLTNYYKWIQCDTIVILRATMAGITTLLSSSSQSTYSVYKDILKPLTPASNIGEEQQLDASSEPVITAVAFYPGMHDSVAFKHLRTV